MTQPKIVIATGSAIGPKEFVEVPLEAMVPKSPAQPTTGGIFSARYTLEVPDLAAFKVRDNFGSSKRCQNPHASGSSLYFSEKFQSRLFQKKESAVAATTVAVDELGCKKNPKAVLSVLGDAAELQLSQLWFLLKQHQLHNDRSKGVSLYTYGLTVCFVRDAMDKLLIVTLDYNLSILWNGWHGDVFETSDRHPFPKGAMILSRQAVS